jgi:DNA invertase Pin-like site-specific DNA recombinase
MRSLVPDRASAIPAAQYVRMSTEDQQYSIANQKEAIGRFAEDHGYYVVSTYTDAGRSGVAIKTRVGLTQLLKDVVTGQAHFGAILVYDVSRWGRFQDADEAAHYEFLCKSAGIPVRYCAEQFDNDGSIPSTLMKAIKRSMAAEFSRELAVKVFAGQCRLAKEGFRVCGTAGLGLRRMMVSIDGSRNLILKTGEHKAIKTCHTTLVLGPKKETECIRTIFSLALDKSYRAIAQELNRRKIGSIDGRPWHKNAIYRILRNEKYMGSSVFGKVTTTLGGPTRPVPRDLWIRYPHAFAAIVEPEQFELVQRAIQKRRTVAKTDREVLNKMRKVLAREGKLTQRILSKRGAFDPRMFSKRFGSILQAYELIGYKPSSHAFKSVANQAKIKRLTIDLFNRLKDLFPHNLRFIHLPGQTNRKVLEFDNKVRITVHVCRRIDNTAAGESRWILKTQPLEAGYPCLICTTNSDLNSLDGYYVIPHFGDVSKKYKVVKESHKLLTTGKKLLELSQLCEVGTQFDFERQTKDDSTRIGDVLITARTSTIKIGRDEIMLPPVQAELFKLLIRSDGEVVSRAHLSHPFSGKEFPSAHLNVHISELRRRLGVYSERILTVKKEGYMYMIVKDELLQITAGLRKLAAL